MSSTERAVVGEISAENRRRHITREMNGDWMDRESPVKHWRDKPIPFDEPVPGMREQAERIEKIYHENSWAKLRAIIVGDVEYAHIPDVSVPANAAVIEHWPEPVKKKLRENPGALFKDAWPEKYAQMKEEFAGYRDILEDEGVTVVTNRDHVVPENVANYYKGFSDDAIMGQMRLNVSIYGNILFQNTAHPSNTLQTLLYYEFFQEIMKRDRELIWLSGPPPYPSDEHSDYVVQPVINYYGNSVSLPGKIIVVGIGVEKPEDIYDPRAPRNSVHNEVGFEVGRRMLEPFGFKVIPVYFNAHLTYDFESMWLRMEDGKLGLPENALWPHEGSKGPYNMPKELADDWEVFITPTDEFMRCCNNTIPLGNGRHLMKAHGPKTMDVMVKAGQEPIPVPFEGLPSAMVSGMHCHSFPIHREND